MNINMTKQEFIEIVTNAVSSQVSPLATQMQDMSMQMGQMREHMNHMDERLDHMDERLDHMDERLDHMDERLDHMDERLDGLEQGVDELQDRTKRLELNLENNVIPRLQVIEDCYLSTYKRYSSENDKMETLQQDVDVLKTVVSLHSEQIKDLQKRA